MVPAFAFAFDGTSQGPPLPEQFTVSQRRPPVVRERVVWANIKGLLWGLDEAGGMPHGKVSFSAIQDDENSPFPHAESHGYEMTISRISSGDILPALGSLYRVGALSGVSPDAQRMSVEFHRLHEQKWPPGIRVASDSYVVSVAGHTRLHGQELRVKSVSAATSDSRPAAAEIGIGPNQASLRYKTVRVGDLMAIGEFAHKVRNIVPPDAKQHVVGWVELDPNPVAAEEKPQPKPDTPPGPADKK